METKLSLCCNAPTTTRHNCTKCNRMCKVESTSNGSITSEEAIELIRSVWDQVPRTDEKYQSIWNLLNKKDYKPGPKAIAKALKHLNLGNGEFTTDPKFSIL